MFYLKLDGDGIGYVIDLLGVQVDTHVSFVTLVVVGVSVAGLRLRKILRDKKKRLR